MLLHFIEYTIKTQLAKNKAHYAVSKHPAAVADPAPLMCAAGSHEIIEH